MYTFLITLRSRSTRLYSFDTSFTFITVAVFVQGGRQTLGENKGRTMLSPRPNGLAVALSVQNSDGGTGLAGLFAISGYSGGASGWFFGGLGGDFLIVFGQFPGRHFKE